MIHQRLYLGVVLLNVLDGRRDNQPLPLLILYHLYLKSGLLRLIHILLDAEQVTNPAEDIHGETPG
jgi:hypothetical protein